MPPLFLRYCRFRCCRYATDRCRYYAPMPLPPAMILLRDAAAIAAAMSAAIIDAATSRHASRFRPLPFRRHMPLLPPPPPYAA
jgi:hypothetical protein